MHVVQVNSVFEPGSGAEGLLARYETLLGWSRALLAAGARRATIVQRAAVDAELQYGAVRVLLRHDGDRPRPRPWARLARCAQAALAQAPDVLHFNGLVCPGALGELRRGLPAGRALVVQDHGAARVPRDPVRRALWRTGLRAADVCLFTATAQAESWIDAGLLERERVLAVPEASRECHPPPREQARAMAGLRGGPALLWVGHLDSNKDPLTVLEGFEQALARLPRAALTLVYRGQALLPAVRHRLARSPALAAAVELRGALPAEAVTICMAAADFFVLGSRREGSGYALLEALACGLPPLVSDNPAFRALTGEGWLGEAHLPPALWSAGDARAFAQALWRAAEADSAALRARARRHFERELSWEAVGRRACAAYEHALQAAQRSAGRRT